jgi:hypothetical protein
MLLLLRVALGTSTIHHAPWNTSTSIIHVHRNVSLILHHHMVLIILHYIWHQIITKYKSYFSSLIQKLGSFEIFSGIAALIHLEMELPCNGILNRHCHQIEQGHCVTNRLLAPCIHHFLQIQDNLMMLHRTRWRYPISYLKRQKLPDS